MRYYCCAVAIGCSGWLLTVPCIFTQKCKFAENVFTLRPSKMKISFFFRTDLEKFSSTSLANQCILCSVWVPSEWEFRQLIKTAQLSTSDSSSSKFQFIVKRKAACLQQTNPSLRHSNHCSSTFLACVRTFLVHFSFLGEYICTLFMHFICFYIFELAFKLHIESFLHIWLNLIIVML